MAKKGSSRPGLFGTINHYDSKLVINGNATDSQIDDVVSEVNGDKIMESSIEIESDGAKKSGSLLVMNDTDLITPTDYDWNKVDIKDDEVSISQKMADMLGVKVGDKVKWHIMGSDKWVKTKIDKIHADPTSQGLIMSLDKLEDLLKFLIPNYINEGKNQLVIAIGCTGGKHRSVTLANAITKRLGNLDYGIKVEHRDIGKDTANVVFRRSEEGAV